MCADSLECFAFEECWFPNNFEELVKAFGEAVGDDVDGPVKQRHVSIRVREGSKTPPKSFEWTGLGEYEFRRTTLVMGNGNGKRVLPFAFPPHAQPLPRPCASVATPPAVANGTRAARV